MKVFMYVIPWGDYYYGATISEEGEELLTHKAKKFKTVFSYLHTHIPPQVDDFTYLQTPVNNRDLVTALVRGSKSSDEVIERHKALGIIPS